jgi:peptidoglycan/LPS O-acetylase OafA/YrhL
MTALAASPVSAKPRAGALDALRFLAASFIVLYHFGPNAPVDLASSAAIFQRGWLATDFFLILSGYILGRAYGRALDERRLNVTTFFLRRVTRVWPAQLMMLGALAVLVLAAGLAGVAPDSPERFQWSDFLAQASLTHAWGVTHQAGWNEPSWTLSALVVCYAAFPVVWFLSRPLNGRGAALVIALALLVGASLLSVDLLGRPLFDLPFHLGVLRALPLFAFGALLARFSNGRRLGRAVCAAVGLATLGAFIAIQAPARTELTATVSILALASIIVSADGLRLSSPPWMQWLADMSFALFITHALVGAVWFSLEEQLGLTSSWLAWSLGFMAALVFAGLFHRFVDQPIQARVRKALARPDRTTEPQGQLA